MARLLSDEDFSRRVVEELRQLGHDVVTARELGLANQGTQDPLILLVATRDARAVLTYNRRDFGRLHLTDANHSGIIVCTRDPDVVRQAQRIHAAIATLENLTGRLIRVTRPGPGTDSV
jgi:predicted nuclease of predicted toxin-antitoxin system